MTDFKESLIILLSFKVILIPNCNQSSSLHWFSLSVRILVYGTQDIKVQMLNIVNVKFYDSDCYSYFFTIEIRMLFPFISMDFNNGFPWCSIIMLLNFLLENFHKDEVEFSKSLCRFTVVF